ncbi:MAG: gliding motility protein GldN [Flavobacteriales bacterium]|nr:gliding motility protein GldN [Flavobacteriales bacterium]
MKCSIISLACLCIVSSFHLPAQEYLPAHHIREADVMWSQRVWRELDLKQKINQPLYYPVHSSQGYSSLYDVLTEAIHNGVLTAYGTGPLGQNDEMEYALSPSEVKAITHSLDSVYTPRLDGNGHELVIVEDSIRSEMVTRYRIKEEWIFDRNRSQMVVRILGIAPLVEQFAEDGSSRGFTTLFWVDYGSCRDVLADAPVFIRHNDNRQLNYDDIFAKRFFDSYVVKSSNVYDRPISSYAQGIDALLEGESIEEDIRNFEFDLWSH